jgi:hypothetical protein
MENIQLYKNKPETFKCQFKIDGIDPDDTTVRLCLEFDNNKNLFFYGKINDNGSCDIQIPSLNEIKQKNGKLVIEAIADSTYFKVYEANVELKTSVGVELLKAESVSTKPKKSSPKVTLESMESEKPKESSNPYVPRLKKFKRDA